MTIAEYFKWLKKEWAKVGFILSIFLLVILLTTIRKYDYVLFILLLQAPLYMLHQTEEYVFPGGFGRFFTTQIFKFKTEDGPIGENLVFWVNVMLTWIAFPVFALLSTINPAYGLWMPYFVFFAGVGHIGLAIKAKKLYNPGLVVSLLVNIPLGFWSILSLVRVGELNNFFWNPYCLIGFGLNAMLPVAGVFMYRDYVKKENATSPDSTGRS